MAPLRDRGAASLGYRVTGLRRGVERSGWVASSLGFSASKVNVKITDPTYLPADVVFQGNPALRESFASSGVSVRKARQVKSKTYQVGLGSVSILELAIKPDLTPDNAFATLARWRMI
jgi:hypothetical protein